MPITNHSQLVRFSNMCGAEIPRWIRLRLADFGDDRASIKAFGVDVMAQLCQTLLDRGVPGLHFYTLNSADAVLAVWNRLTAPAELRPKIGRPSCRARGCQYVEISVVAGSLKK